jgi:hypothetical protein
MKSKNWMMILLALSGTAGMQLWSGLAHAANAVPNLTDIVKDTDGLIRGMTQYEAKNYCRSQGQRLPTIRELALYAQSLGARGISETPEVGYHPVKGFDSSGHPDNFYYSNYGYQRPAGDLAKVIWSSSVGPYDYDENDGPADFVQTLDSKWGYITQQRSYSTFAVRCVQSP